MNDDLNQLAKTLNAVLAEETDFLDALDYNGAVALLPRKQDAVAALQGAIFAGIDVAGMEEEALEALKWQAEVLDDLAEANRQAIERAMALQTEVIQTIANAVPKGRAAEAPAYQPDGTKAPSRPFESYAFTGQM